MSISIRNGKYMLRTGCGHCKAEFTSPARAQSHLQKQHRPKRFVAPSGEPLFSVRWTRKGLIEREIPLNMSMGEEWGSRGPDLAG
jgi:hypothetical protein